LRQLGKKDLDVPQKNGSFDLDVRRKNAEASSPEGKFRKPGASFPGFPRRRL
jgi:hypothetical protein